MTDGTIMNSAFFKKKLSLERGMSAVCCSKLQCLTR